MRTWVRMGWLTSLLALATPACAEDFTLTDVKFDFLLVTASIPKMEVKGANITQAEFRHLFDGKDLSTLPARLAAFSADSISAPQISTVFNSANGLLNYSDSYEKVSFERILGGKIAQVTVSNATSTQKSQNSPPTKILCGATSLKDFDLKLQVESMITTRPAGSAPQFKPLYSSLVIDSIVQEISGWGTVKLGPITSSDVKISLGSTAPREAFASIFKLSEEREAARAQGRDPALDPTNWVNMLSILEDMRMGAWEIKNISFSADQSLIEAMRKHDPAPHDEPITLKIASITLNDTGEVAQSGITINGLEYLGPPGPVSAERISASGFSMMPALAALRAQAGTGKKLGPDFAWTKLLPTLGNISVEGARVITAKRLGPVTHELLVYDLRKAGFSVRAQENGIPTDMRIGIEGLNAPLPNDSSTKDLWAMGYRRVNLSTSADLGWNRDTNEIALREIALDSADMLRLKLSGNFGNATRDLFSGDAALAQVAGLGLTAKALDARLDNLGLAEKLLAFQAGKSGRKPEDLRSEFGMLAAMALPAMLGDSDSGKALSGALARFIAKPGNLTLKLSAKSASGLGLADVIGIADPKAVLNKINVEARAE